MSNRQELGATAAADYTIRAYESEDLDGVLRVDRRVWRRERSPEWFRWKYVDNPFVDQPPVFVAEHDAEIVGARPFVAMPLCLGDTVVMALQPADTMVDPDHRRQGVFRRMTEYALEYYRDSDYRLFFNFPNQHVKPGYLKLGWRAVTPKETYYRIETPSAVASSGLRGRAAGLCRPPLQAYYALQARRSGLVDGFVSQAHKPVQQVDGADIDRLVGLHSRRRPEQIHADRSEEFLRWRLASPLWSRRTYLVGGSRPLVAVVARSRTTSDGIRLTQIADIAPLCGGQRWEHGLERALKSIVATHPQTDLFAASNGAIPHRVLASLGFLSDCRLPLSWAASFESTLAVRPNGEPARADWLLDGVAVDDSDSWCVTFLERDTA